MPPSASRQADGVVLADALQQGGGARVEVRAARGDAQRRGGRAAGGDAAFAVAVAAEGALPRHAVPDGAADRRLDHAEDRHAVFDERDVDGELAVALQELAGAVERVDQPEARPAAALFQRDRVCGLLRQHRDLRRQPRQAVDDAAVRGEVGGGDRAGIGLGAHGEVVAVVHRHDRDAGVAGDGDHAFAQDLIQHGAAASRGR